MLDSLWYSNYKDYVFLCLLLFYMLCFNIFHLCF
jgi:hypothetical protein